MPMCIGSTFSSFLKSRAACSRSCTPSEDRRVQGPPDRRSANSIGFNRSRHRFLELQVHEV